LNYSSILEENKNLADGHPISEAQKATSKLELRCKIARRLERLKDTVEYATEDEDVTKSIKQYCLFRGRDEA
jgi:hypothetical protein